MIQRNDDDVMRYQRVLVDFRGWNVAEFVKARYVAWGCWAGLTVILFALAGARFFGGPTGLLYSAAAALGLTLLAAPHLSNEVGPHAWWQTGLAENRAWRTAQARAKEATAPVQRWTRERKP